MFFIPLGVSTWLPPIYRAISVTAYCALSDWLTTNKRNNEKKNNYGMVELPVLGFIACGEPIEPYTDPNATLPVDSSLVKHGDKSFDDED